MAHTKASGVTKGNRDSVAKRLGVKLFAGQQARPGSIIIRQKGTKFSAGPGTKLGNDYTLFAIKEGIVNFGQKLGKKFVSVS